MACQLVLWLSAYVSICYTTLQPLFLANWWFSTTLTVYLSQSSWIRGQAYSRDLPFFIETATTPIATAGSHATTAGQRTYRNALISAASA